MIYDSTKYSLKRLIETRWNYSYDSIIAINETFPALKLCLEWISESKDTEKAVLAKGLIYKVCNIQFILTLKVFKNIFSKLNEFFKQLQFETIGMSTVISLIDVTKKKFLI